MVKNGIYEKIGNNIIRDALRKKKVKIFGHLSNRWVGVPMKTKKEIKHNFVQEYREGGGQVRLSKLKNYAKNMRKVTLCLTRVTD